MKSHVAFLTIALLVWSVCPALGHVKTDSMETGPDIDEDDLPDAWEYGHTNTLVVLGAGDSDGDGVSDGDEYGADTDPFDSGEFLKVTALDRAGNQDTVSWRSRSTRLYSLEGSGNVADEVSRSDGGLGLLSPDAGTETSHSVAGPTGTQRFYRVGAVVPLSVDPSTPMSDTAIADEIFDSRYQDPYAAAGLHSNALLFLPPWGGGRNSRNGVLVQADADEWGTTGTRWSLDYVRSDQGLELIHPLVDGHVIIHLERNSLSVSSPRQWILVGYGQGDLPITTKPGFDDIFPLEPATVYAVVTYVGPSGDIEVWVNDVLVGEGSIASSSAIDFSNPLDLPFPGGSSWATKQFSGEGFPFQWPQGAAGIIIKPVDSPSGNYNRCYDVRFAPGVQAMP